MAYWDQLRAPALLSEWAGWYLMDVLDDNIPAMDSSKWWASTFGRTAESGWVWDGQNRQIRILMLYNQSCLPFRIPWLGHQFLCRYVRNWIGKRDPCHTFFQPTWHRPIIKDKFIDIMPAIRSAEGFKCILCPPTSGSGNGMFGHRVRASVSGWWSGSLSEKTEEKRGRVTFVGAERSEQRGIRFCYIWWPYGRMDDEWERWQPSGARQAYSDCALPSLATSTECVNAWMNESHPNCAAESNVAMATRVRWNLDPAATKYLVPEWANGQ